MKLQSYELPLGKSPQQQTRRKTPKIAHLLLLAFLLITIIPIYYPSLLTYNLRKLSQPSTSSFDLNLLDSKFEDNSVSEQPRREENIVAGFINKEEEKIEVAAGIINERRQRDDLPEESTSTTYQPYEKLETGIVNEQRQRDELPEESTSTVYRPDENPEKGIVNERRQRDELPEESTSTAYQSDEKSEIVNERRQRDELPEESTSTAYESDENSQKGIVNERRRDELPEVSTSTAYQPDENSEKGIVNERRRDELPEISTSTSTTTYQASKTEPSNTDEKLETGSSNERRHEERKRSRKKGGKRRTGHRKKEPEEIGKGIINSNFKEIESNELLIKQNTSSSSCDLFSGEWIPNPEGPYYTNETCWAIQEHQNCLKFGRPDREYLKWRWKPDECELPIFDPSQFLELVRGKSLAFVGDSVARNHMQSLICLLSRVVYPEDVSKSINDQNRRYEYRDYNFTIFMFWSPYLVKTQLTEPGNVTRPFNLYLDEFDPHWTAQIKHQNYVIISAGQWFMRPTYFYDKGKLLGCLYCPSSDNIPYKTAYFSYRRAFRTAFKAINSVENFNGVTYLRTFAPSHFEGGAWDKGGKCARKIPYKRNETGLEDYSEKMYRIQLEELEIGRRKGKKFRLFDATKAMQLRADGHPSKYGHWPQQKVELAEDCVHWCLPGPIDSWNDFLLQLLKNEQQIHSQ